MNSRCHLPWCASEHEDAPPPRQDDHCSEDTTVELALDAVTLALQAVCYEASQSARPLIVLRLEQAELADKDWALLAPDEALRLSEALRELASALQSGDHAAVTPC